MEMLIQIRTVGCVDYRKVGEEELGRQDCKYIRKQTGLCVEVSRHFKKN